MNEQFRSFFDALRATDVGTKIVIGMSSVAMVAAIAVVAMVSNDSHYEVMWPDLSSAEAARVSQALALKGIDFHTQRADGTVVIMVASDETGRANLAAYESGAITGIEKGILAGGADMGGVFDGADARNMKLQAAFWSQTEAILQEFEFVESARLQVFGGSSKSGGSRVKPSASVVLTTLGGVTLSKAEGQSVANVIIHSLGIDPTRLTVTDQNGYSAYTPQDKNDASGEKASDYQRGQDEYLIANAMQRLTTRYGPNKVDVFVLSDYDFSLETKNTHTPTKGAKNSERLLKTETPVGGSSYTNGGGVAGTASNTASGVDQWTDAGTSGPTGGADVPMSTTTDSEFTSIPGYETVTFVKMQPKLMHRAISVGIDESLKDNQADIDAMVQALVGYDVEREDSYVSKVSLFPVLEVPAPGELGGEALPEASGMDTNFLIERGVEIVSAIAFIFLLLKGLKNAKGSATAGEQRSAGANASPVYAADGTSVPDIEIAPEQLARAQVDDLVKNNPERVAAILSNWVVEDRNTVNS
jgi:flagellar biosynthesis/type III secretory pathway M-ring protein FliF/YscJ